MKTKDRVILVIIIAVMCTASLLAGAFINKSWGAEEEKIDCSKYKGIVWLGEIRNPSSTTVEIRIYSNEQMESSWTPYFNSFLEPGESAKIEFKCGENSVIMKYENAFKGYDFNVPGSFDNQEEMVIDLKQDRVSI